MAKRAVRQPVAVTRMNIYLPDPAVRRQIKTAAARRHLSMSEYCVRAIIAQLARDGERRTPGDTLPPLRSAVAAARRFRAEVFGTRTFTVGSAEVNP